MSLLGQHFGGLIFGTSLFFAFLLTGIISDKIDITVKTSFETQYNDCQQKLSYFEQQQQVVCKAEQPPIFFPMFSSFMAGGLSVGWLILFGYPFIKNKLEQKKATK